MSCRIKSENRRDRGRISKSEREGLCCQALRPSLAPTMNAGEAPRFVSLCSILHWARVPAFFFRMQFSFLPLTSTMQYRMQSILRLKGVEISDKIQFQPQQYQALSLRNLDVGDPTRTRHLYEGHISSDSH